MTLKRRSSAITVVKGGCHGLAIHLNSAEKEVVEKKPKLSVAEEKPGLSKYISSGLPDFPSLKFKDHHYVLEILDVDTLGYMKTLKCQCVSSKQYFDVRLEGIWGITDIKRTNQIRLVDPVIDHDTLIVNNSRGLVIVEPNYLVSSTTLVQALFCKRKAVLSEKFRQPGSNIQMTLGNVCHELFQSVLKRRPKFISSAWLLAEYRKSILPFLIIDFILLDITTESFEKMLAPYLTNITTWMKKYLPQPWGQNAPLVDGHKIADIEDIEMNIWSNGVGVKGKIDVALKTTDNRVVPLELKTGKSSASTDHQAQVLMYSLIISELEDGKIDPGILLYLKDGTERVIPPKAADLKGILQTRNGMATFSKALDIESFPDPREDPRFCGTCPYNLHCSVLQKLSTSKSPGITIEMEAFAKNKYAHLAQNELDYCKQWLEWSFMEWKTDRKKKNMTGIFEQSPSIRENMGTCISDLKLELPVKVENGSVFMTFTKENQTPLPSGVLEANELIIISTSEAVAVLSGYVSERTITSITIKTDKELPKHYTTAEASHLYHIDQYTTSASFPMQLNAIMMLLEDSTEAKRLREFVIDLKEPTFGTLTKSNLESIKDIVRKCSKTQARAIIRALSAKDYLLIQGFPGSGKTSTIVGLVKCLMKLNKTVLLTAYTNSAVDNMLLRLKEVLPEESMIRIGGNYSSSRHVDIKPLMLEEKLAGIEDKKNIINVAKKLLSNTPIIATTCLTAGSHNFFSWRKKFDYCIVDEAALSLQSSIIKPLLLGDVQILVGDCRQLEPLVVNKEAKTQGMAVSMMERWEPIAEKANGIVKLNEQYRMNSKICELSSELFYDGLLKCATEEVSKRTIENTGDDEAENTLVPKDLLNLILSSSLDDSVIFIDTLSRSASQAFTQNSTMSTSKSNQGEVDLVSRICNAYISAGISPTSIGAMSTYRKQVEELRKILPSSIETNTVDQYQGRDKDIVIISLVHTSLSDDEYCNESLLSERRVNVALTRAKKKLIIVGCLESLSAFPLMKQMIEKISNVYKYSSV